MLFAVKVFRSISKLPVLVCVSELELRKQTGGISDSTIVLALEDPKGQVGSGGATINALLVVTEYISVQSGYTVTTSHNFTRLISH